MVVYLRRQLSLKKNLDKMKKVAVIIGEVTKHSNGINLSWSDKVNGVHVEGEAQGQFKHSAHEGRECIIHNVTDEQDNVLFTVIGYL